MSVVQTLAEIARCVVVFGLTGNEETRQRLVAHFRTGAYAAISGDVLHDLIDLFPGQLTNELLSVVCPPHTRSLDIGGCTSVSLTGILGVLNKCPHMKSINLTGCDHMMQAPFFSVLSKCALNLVTLTLDECQQLTSLHVQKVLVLLPNLQRLSVAQTNITDAAFLTEPTHCACQLTHVNVSGCQTLTHVAVANLTQQTGPTLQHINLSFTQMDTAALWYLCGFTLRSAMQIGGWFTQKSGDLLSPRHNQDSSQTTPSESEQVRDLFCGNTISALLKTLKKGVGDGDISTNNGQKSQFTGKYLNVNEYYLDNSDFDGKSLNTSAKNSNNCEFGAKNQSAGKFSADVLETSECSPDTLETTEFGGEVLKTSEFSAPNNHRSECIATNFDTSERSLNKKITGDILQTELENVHIVTKSVPECTNANTCAQKEKEVLRPYCEEIDAVEKTSGKIHTNAHKFSDFNTVGGQLVDASEDPYKNNGALHRTERICHDALHVFYSQPNRGGTVCDKLVLLNCGEQNDVQSGGYGSNSGLHTNARNVSESGRFKLDVARIVRNEQGQVKCDPEQVWKVPEIPCDFELESHRSGYMKNNEIDIISSDLVTDYRDIGEIMPIASAIKDGCDTSEGLCVKTGMTLKEAKHTVEPASSSAASDNSEKLHDTLCKTEDIELNKDRSPSQPVLSGAASDSHEVHDNLYKNEDIDISKDRNPYQPASSDAASNNSEKLHDPLYKTETTDSTSNKVECPYDSTRLSASFNDQQETSFCKTKDPRVQSSMNPEFGCRSFHLFKAYNPVLTSLEVCSQSMANVEVFNACVKSLFLVNPGMRRLELSLGQLTDEVVEYIAEHAPNLHDLSLLECEGLTSKGVQAVCTKCPLKYLNLRGVCFIQNYALFPLWSHDHLISLTLAECNITEVTLDMIAQHAPQLMHLDLSWCEEIAVEENPETFVKFLQSGGSLQTLLLRHLPLCDPILFSLAEHCVALRELNLSSVAYLNDGLLLGISLRCRQLEHLDVSWNSDLTDVSFRGVLLHLLQLRDLRMNGVKQMTSGPLMPIIADLSQWRRCQALLRFKLQERHLVEENGDTELSSDEECDDLFIPHRSTSFAPSLRHLSLEYSDRQTDAHLAEIVAVCRGTLNIVDYYGSPVEPCYISCRGGLVFKSDQFVAL